MEGSGAFEELSGREVGEMNIKTIPISKIHPAAYNPRKDLKPSDPEYQRLAKAVDRFGMVEPLVWNERTGNLVGGHQRFKILKQGGAKTVEVSIVDLDDRDEKALNIALNKQGGEWDLASLDSMLKELQASDFDMDVIGFDLSELEDFQSVRSSKNPTMVESKYCVLIECKDEAEQIAFLSKLTKQKYQCRALIS